MLGCCVHESVAEGTLLLTRPTLFYLYLDVISSFVPSGLCLLTPFQGAGSVYVVVTGSRDGVVSRMQGMLA